MSTTTTTRLQPPANDPPIAEAGGQHSQAWADYFQVSADQLATLPAKVRKGVTDGSDAAAGDIGEYLTATSGAVALSNGVTTNVVSLSLTAGDWDVAGGMAFTAGSGTHNGFGAGITSIDAFTTATFPSVAINQMMPTGTRRVNVTTTTTVWAVGVAYFGGGAMTATGSIRARRAR